MAVFAAILAIVILPLVLWVASSGRPSVMASIIQVVWASTIFVGLILFNSVESYTRELGPLLVAGLALIVCFSLALVATARLTAAYVLDRQ